MADLKRTPDKKGRGDFFAIDARVWAAVCRHDIVTAIAYLIMARGTGPDMRSTAWSATAIEERTAIRWSRAKEAVNLLISKGYVRRLREGQHPRYFILAADAVDHGFGATGGADWIWLPNQLVDSIDGRKSPIEAIRQTHDVTVLRFLTELYRLQDLAAFGGVHWQEIRRDHARHRLAEAEGATIWGFEKQGSMRVLSPMLCGLFDKETLAEKMGKAFRILEGVGLLDVVTHLVDSVSRNGEVMFPYPVAGGHEAEQRLARDAHQAGLSLLDAAAKERVRQDDLRVVPVASHVEALALVGLVRLRYRTRTSATARWLSSVDQWKDEAERFRRIARRGKVSGSTRDQSLIKEGSTMNLSLVASSSPAPAGPPSASPSLRLLPPRSLSAESAARLSRDGGS